MCYDNYIQLPSLGDERLPQVPDVIAGLPLCIPLQQRFLSSDDEKYRKRRMNRPRTGNSTKCSQGKAEGVKHKKIEQCESKN
jgi:hypothetical protein